MNSYQFWSGAAPSIIAFVCLAWAFVFLTGIWPLLCRAGARVGMFIYRAPREFGLSVGRLAIEITRSPESIHEQIDDALQEMMDGE